jgi:hypothetical protein
MLGMQFDDWQKFITENTSPHFSEITWLPIVCGAKGKKWIEPLLNILYWARRA